MTVSGQGADMSGRAGGVTGIAGAGGPERIQLKRSKGWRKPEGAVVVSRPSRWGNPFRVYRGHTLIGPDWFEAKYTLRNIPASHATAAYITSSEPITPAALVHQFRMLMNVRLRDEPRRTALWLTPLAGHDLACWCPLDQPCHADVLLELANGVPS